MEFSQDYIDQVNRSPIEYLQVYHEQVGAYYIAEDGKIVKGGLE